ncbi:MAG: hypothetical protein E6Q97_33070 [Desulfurellales bacterium]|nr:MAG: hypothetical protein E6Q97_33070 [Desulfurellales bacterium]
MTPKKQKAYERNWAIFRLAGVVRTLTTLSVGPSNFTDEERDEAAQLSNDAARLLKRVRKNERA